MEIDIKKLTEEAVKHMEDDGDVRWPIGMALQEMYWDKGWGEVQDRLVKLYNDKAKDNTYS
jgi:hypothetical protein